MISLIQLCRKKNMTTHQKVMQPKAHEELEMKEHSKQSKLEFNIQLI